MGESHTREGRVKVHNRDWHERLNLPLQRRSQAPLNTRTTRQYYYQSISETHQNVMASTLDGGEHGSRGSVHQSISYIRTSVKPRSYSSTVRSIHYRKAGLSCCSNTNTAPMAPVSPNLHEAWRSIAAWRSQGW